VILVYSTAYVPSISADQNHLASATSDTASQIATLNHFYAIIDDETADAIQTSAFLRQFSNLNVKTVTANDGQSWTGRCMSGRETYAEFFAAADVAPPNPTTVGSGVAIRSRAAHPIRGRAHVARVPDAPRTIDRTRRQKHRGPSR
jgi:hypothetical protein